MNIGINAVFARKPATGIGQVTVNFLHTLAAHQPATLEPVRYILYTQEPLDFPLPENFEVKSFLPHWWTRDDIPRQWLWERAVASRAKEDQCTVLLSLSQSATVCDPSLKHVMIVHDIIPKLFQEYLGKWSQRLHWKSIERAICRADSIITVSQSTKGDLVRCLNISSERISVAYPGLSPVFEQIVSDKTVQEVLTRYSLTRGYIYHGGGLEMRKNTRAVLESYATLREKRRDLPFLVISGHIHDRKNPLATDIRGLIGEYHLEDSVKLLGRVPEEDLPALYRGASMFVYPSYYEGFGLPPLEAFSQETPVIASRKAALPEVCSAGAVFIDLDQSQDIVAALEKFLDDVSLRETLGRAGKMSLEKFSYTQFVDTVLKQCFSV